MVDNSLVRNPTMAFHLRTIASPSTCLILDVVSRPVLAAAFKSRRSFTSSGDDGTNKYCDNRNGSLNATAEDLSLPVLRPVMMALINIATIMLSCPTAHSCREPSENTRGVIRVQILVPQKVPIIAVEK